jgi:hypothetical protein
LIRRVVMHGTTHRMQTDKTDQTGRVGVITDPM